MSATFAHHWLRLVVIVDQSRCYGNKPIHYDDLTWKKARTRYGEIFNIIFIILTFMAISSKSGALRKCPKLLSAELFVWFNLSPIAELFLRNWRHAIKRNSWPHSTVFTQQENCCAMTSMLQITAGIQPQYNNSGKYNMHIPIGHNLLPLFAKKMVDFHLYG